MFGIPWGLIFLVLCVAVGWALGSLSARSELARRPMGVRQGYGYSASLEEQAGLSHELTRQAEKLAKIERAMQ